MDQFLNDKTSVARLQDLFILLLYFCCIAVMYAWRGNGTKMDRLISFATGVAVLAVCDGSIEVWAFLMLIPMYFYEGNRGLDNKALRLFFYLFYPVHLLILGLIANLFIL